MKKVIVQFNWTGVNAQLYDKVWEELRGLGITNPKGALHHVAGFQGNNLIVIDTWESLELFNKFSVDLYAIFKKLGVPEVKPIITPVHYEYYSAGAVSGRKAA